MHDTSDRQTDRQTDDLRQQYRALHYVHHTVRHKITVVGKIWQDAASTQIAQGCLQMTP